MKLEQDGKLTAIDVFSGCGGLTTGMKQAGFRMSCAIEIDTKAVATYRANHPEVHVFQNDVRKVKLKQILSVLGKRPGQLDLLAGCAPCQGFSKHRRGRAGDERNTLVLEMLRLTRQLRPAVLLMENVPGLANGVGKDIFTEFCTELEKLKYRFNYKVVDAVDFGVPQHRQRLVFVATRLKWFNVDIFGPTRWNPKEYPDQAHWSTVREAIGFLPPVAVGEESPVPNHVATLMSETNLKRIAHVPVDGGNRSSLPPELQLPCHSGSASYTDTYGRMKWDEPCKTLTTGCTSITKGRYGHPEQNRAITPREAALLQSFPLTYEFPHQRTVVARQVGNAVPPRMAYVLSSRIAHQLLSKC